MAFPQRLYFIPVAGLLLILFFLTFHTLYQSNTRFHQQLIKDVDRQAAVSVLIHELGYSGFIHNFKNYVLRGDSSYYDQAHKSFVALNSEFARLNRAGLELELLPLQDTIDEYRAKLELARELWQQGKTRQEIDNAVKVDDQKAKKAIQDLIFELRDTTKALIQDSERFQDQLSGRLWLVLILTTLIGVAFSMMVFYYIALLGEAKASLVKAEAKLHFHDLAPNAFLLVNEDGVIIEANRGAEVLLAGEQESVVGASIEDFMPKAFRSQHERYRAKFYETKAARTMLNPVPLHLANGEVKQVEVHLGYYQEDGRRYAAVNLVEITNLKELQLRADKFEKNYQATFELAPIGIVHIGLDGRIITVNKQFETLFGYTRYELELMRFQDLSGNTHEPAPYLTDLILESDATYRTEQYLWTKAGNKIWVNLVASCRRDGMEKPDHLIVIVEDITQRKHYEAELLASEERFKTIANHVSGVVWMSTPGADKILFVNERYRTLWGRSEQALYKDPAMFWDAVLTEDRPRVLACLEQHRQGTWNVDYRIRRPSGRVRYIHDEGSAVLDEQGNVQYMVCLAQDMTDEQLYKQRLKATNVQLERLAKFDPLTMTVRRQYATADLEECIALHKRYQRDASLIFIDLDEFKQVNDSYGHDIGDQVLIEFCRRIRENIRETDDFYRYAGDEFIVLLRETNGSEALKFIEKIERVQLSLNIEAHDVIPIRFSSGICSLADKSAKDASDWIRLADQQMYHNKRQRRLKQG